MKNILTLFFATAFLSLSINTIQAQTTTSEVTPKTFTRSTVTTLYKQLGAYLKTNEQQNAKAIPILEIYDMNADSIKIKNAGNYTKIQQETNVLSSKTMESLKKVLSGEQVFKLLFAIKTQDNILNEKNLDVNQKAFIKKVKTEYKLSNEQMTAVALVMVQGKLRGDGIAMLAKTNPQLAGQEYIKLLQDLDSQLKGSLSEEQYKNIKSDIEKLVKGQKV